MRTTTIGRWVAVLAVMAATACVAAERKPTATKKPSGGARCDSPLTMVSYDAKARAMTVTFANGYAYEYAAVPRTVFQELAASKCRGRFFASRIRGKFDYRRVIAPPLIPAPVPPEVDALPEYETPQNIPDPRDEPDPRAMPDWPATAGDREEER